MATRLGCYLISAGIAESPVVGCAFLSQESKALPWTSKLEKTSLKPSIGARHVCIDANCGVARIGRRVFFAYFNNAAFCPDWKNRPQTHHPQPRLSSEISY